MKDLHVRIDNCEANWFEQIKIEIVNHIRERNEWPGADRFPYDGIKNTDLIESMIELCWNCIVNPDSKTFYDPEVIVQAVINRM